MKRLLALFAILTLTTSGFAGEFEKELGEFNKVIAQGNFKLFLTEGEENHIRVENKEPELADENIEITVKGGELKVDIKGSTFKKLELKVYVTYKKISHIESKGASWIKCESKLTGEEIEIKCTQDGYVSAELDCNILRASIITDGDIKLRGKVNIADFKVNAGGFISAVDLKSKDVTAKVSTGGEISVWGTEKMDLKVNTGGTIKYKFDGDESKIAQKTVIAGNIEKIESK